MDSTILNYYLLCSAHSGSRRHIVNDIIENINTVFTNIQIELFLRLQNGVYVAKEYIIGGNENTENILVFM